MERLGRPRVRVLVLIVALAAALGGAPARACGPYLPEAVFTYDLHPDLPLVDLAAGKLGLLQPTWARSYLYVAYHQIGGGVFDGEARRALDGMWNVRLGRAPSSDVRGAVDRWLATRATVVGPDDPPVIDTTRETAPGSYQYFDNCLEDAFTTATRTLAARVADAGRDAAAVREWVAAQDQVFASCNAASPSIPAPLAETASNAARADRAYQIAAAEFYAGRFEEAAAGFRAIAADTGSPWAPYGTYLAARALIRRASLAGAGSGDAAAAATSALDAVLADDRAGALHASARDLRELVRLRTEPEAQTRALAAVLLAPAQDAAVAPHLVDYTVLLDRRLEASPEGRPTGAGAVAARDALSDWLFTFQAADDKAREHAVHTWEETRAPIWLLAAIAKVAAADRAGPALLEAATALDATNPAWPTVTAHAGRLALARGDHAAARARLDALLARADLPPGTVNRLRGLRMAAAETRAELARFAVRVPIAVTYDIDGNELPDDVTDNPALRPFAAGRPSFDRDATYVLNRRLPLATLAALAGDESVDASLRGRIAAAGWVRAALLGDDATLRDFAARLATVEPALAAPLGEATKAAAAERRFATSLVLLRHPGLGPFVRSGIARTAVPDALDHYRDNWWCGAADAGITPPDWYPDVPLAFVAHAERARADDEWARLAKLPSAATVLAARVVAYARAHPQDRRVPEALHLAVRATRFGCTDAGSSAQSKAAFQLLHRGYPQSEWAKRTKYYF